MGAFNEVLQHVQNLLVVEKQLGVRVGDYASLYYLYMDRIKEPLLIDSSFLLISMLKQKNSVFFSKKTTSWKLLNCDAKASV